MKTGLTMARTSWLIQLVLLALASCGCMQSPEARSAKYMDTGKKLLQKNDPARATLQFRNAVQATPTNAEAHYQLGLAYLGTGELRKGIVSLRRAVELNPKHAGARLRLAQLMSNVNDPGVLKEAEQRLQTLLRETPDNADALHTLALTELKLDEPEDAMQHLERAMAAAPRELVLAVTLAQTKLQQNDQKGAEEVLKKACASSPTSADAQAVLGDFYVSQEKLAEAEAQFQKSLAIDPNHAAALLNLATLQNKSGRKQEAERSFERLSKLPAKTYKSIYAVFLFQDGRQDAAIREFERIARENPDDRLARTQLITAYQAVKRMPDAEKLLGEVLQKHPKDLDALLQRSEMFLLAGKYGQAEADLNQVLRLKPAASEGHYILAKLHQVRGATLSYRQELGEALRLNPNLQSVRVELAQSLFASNDAHGALDLLNTAPEFQKWSMPILVQRNWALLALGDTAELRKGIDRGLSLARSGDLFIQDGLCKLRTGNLAGARAAIEEALTLNSADLRALQALNQVYLAQKQPAGALQKVKEYAALQPKSAPVQNFLGSMLLAKGDRGPARAAFTAAKTADPKSLEADLSLAQVDVLDGKPNDAQKRLEAIDSGSGNPTVRLWLGVIAESKGDHKTAIGHFRKVVEMDPNNSQALNNLAYLLAEYDGQKDEALKYAQKAVELDPERLSYCDTLGWILYSRGLYPGAVQYLERAAASKENVVWKYHLAMAYARAGERDRGRATLDAALKLNPKLPEAKVAQEVVEASR